MRNVLLVVFMSFCLSSFAQRIHFGDASNIWRYRYTQWVNPNPNTTIKHQLEFEYENDSIINGLPFRKMIVEGRNYFIYEDTVKSVVYIDDTTKVLYNWNWQANDHFSSLHHGDTLKNVITNVYLTGINGTSHKVFEITTYRSNGQQTFLPYIIVEGIGTLKAPLFPYHVPSWVNQVTHDSLICFENNSFRPLIETKFGVNLDASKCFGGVGISKETINLENIAVHPQPAYGSVTIDLSANTSGSIELYNTVGQRIYRQAFSNKHSLEIVNENWHVLFVYKLTDAITNKTYTGKLIFQ